MAAEAGKRAKRRQGIVFNRKEEENKESTRTRVELIDINFIC